jgi:hypothetical protein
MRGNWIRFSNIDVGQYRGTAQSLNSHPPVGLGQIMLYCRQRDDILVVSREMADGVGRAGVTRERERLAAAATEIDLAPFAACARLLHPGGSAEGIEAFLQALAVDQDDSPR